MISPVTRPMKWILPAAWCGVTATITASGLNLPLAGGPHAAGFGYVFVVSGYGSDFMQGLALYAVAAAGLGAAFMFVPKLTRWRISKGLAWSTLMLMAMGGALMLIAPQVLVRLGEGSEAASSLAQAWAVTWMEAGSRISIAGVLMGLATFAEAYFSRKSYSPASSS
jgi:hypothetical protein